MRFFLKKWNFQDFWIFSNFLKFLNFLKNIKNLNLYDICSEWWGDLTWPKKSLRCCDIWDTNNNTDNWEPEFMTIFVTWQLKLWHWTAFAILAMFVLHVCWFKAKSFNSGQTKFLFLFYSSAFQFPSLPARNVFIKPWIHYRNFILGQKTILTENYENGNSKKIISGWPPWLWSVGVTSSDNDWEWRLLQMYVRGLSLGSHLGSVWFASVSHWSAGKSLR